VRQSAYEGESGSFSVPGRTAAVFVAQGAGRGAVSPGVYLPLLIAGGLALLLLAALAAQVRGSEPFSEGPHHG
jgi:hypothetical protein